MRAMQYASQVTRPYRGCLQTAGPVSAQGLPFFPHGAHGVQDRFGKAPDVIRRTSDVDEGLCFEWAPAVMPLPDSPASVGAVAITGPYMPLQGSLLPDTDLESFPVQHSLAALVGRPSSLLLEHARGRALHDLMMPWNTGLPELKSWLHACRTAIPDILLLGL